ncbi:amidohydrolase [Corynebacterium ulceribovis]|uniref:amidohydrolase n=1 Tax=Corynebacterium ulceribovis TaxID=487732 RepID=UPI00036F828C|nr:amidohydrolase [Corynebacterium ulceribovis]
METLETFISNWWQENEAEVLGWRRHLHRHPELSHMEYDTTRFITNVLTSAGMEPQPFPGTGTMVDIGDDGGKRRLAFRGDIDALPITEETALPFESEVPGVMHACGHDVHTTVTLATAVALHEYDQKYGLPIGVRCIFQPAEEVMTGGAKELVKFGALNGVGRIVALHAEPKLRVGRVGIRIGPITSAADTLTITVHGDGGHTSRPHLTQDVVYGLGALVTQLPGLLSRRVDPRTGTVLVFGAINAGHAHNAIPMEGSVMGTIRTGDIKIWRKFQPLLEELIADVLRPTGLRFSIDYIKGVPPVVNDDATAALIAAAVRKVDPHALVEAPQSSGGEDFSWYLEEVPGAMARLGCWRGTGPKGDLHAADLVIDEQCLGVGVRLFAGVVGQYAPEAAGDLFTDDLLPE